MTKKPTVTTLASGFNSTETLNANFEALRDGFDNTLSLDGSLPNAMEADLDLNGNNIIGAAGLLINGTDYLSDVEAAKTVAEAAKDAALAALDSFDDRYLGAKASDPTLDNDGNALVAGALYYNTTDDVMKVYEGTVWVAAYASLSGALVATNNLSDVSSVSSSRTNLGLATVASTGGYSDLTGLPTLGTAAATAATDYATAAQGTLADSAVQPNDSPTLAALAIGGTDVISSGRQLQNITSFSASTIAGLVPSGPATEGVTVASDGNGGLIYYEPAVLISSSTFTTSSTFTVPTGATFVLVEVQGGGAGGGGTNASNVNWFHSGGGGGGGYIKGSYAISAGTVITVTVGTGGAGGYGMNNGTSGTASKVVAGGVEFATGNGGTRNTNSTGGAGGTVAHNTLVDVISTNGSQAANGGSVQSFYGGIGGDSELGTGGAGTFQSTAGAGTGYGGGGGGVGTNNASNYRGGGGSDGTVIIQAWSKKPL